MILVVGSSGFLGGLITQRLLEQGQSVRILRRRNPVYQTLIEAGAESVWGDLKDRSSLDTACQGVDIVITTANAASRGGDDTFENVDLHGTLALIDAAKANGVKQFIYVSAYGSNPESPNPLLKAKAQCEYALHESGLTYTILKPHIFIEVWVGTVIGIPLKVGEPITLVEQGSKRHSFVSVSDIAAVAIATVDNPLAFNQDIDIGGSTSVSWTELVNMVSRIVERSLTIRYVKIGEPVPLISDVMAQLLYATETYEVNINMAHTCQVFNLMLTPTEQVVRRLFSGIG
jgi:uncharacterized protein YbjT (DUF2867 family)